MAEVPGGDGGGAIYRAFDAMKTAGGVFEDGAAKEGTRMAETQKALGERNPELAAAVETQDRKGGPEHLQGGEPKQLTAAERNPGTAAEQSEGNVAERKAEVATLEDEIMGLDPMPLAPSARTEARTETATA